MTIAHLSILITSLIFAVYHYCQLLSILMVEWVARIMRAVIQQQMANLGNILGI